MGNKNRGEVSFEASGKTWTMKVGTSAMCEIEAATGKSIAEVGQALGNQQTATITLLRAVFWGALQDQHEGTTLKEAGSLMDEVGVQRVGELIGEAFQLAFPQKAAGASDPRKATAA